MVHSSCWSASSSSGAPGSASVPDLRSSPPGFSPPVSTPGAAFFPAPSPSPNFFLSLAVAPSLAMGTMAMGGALDELIE